MDPSPILTFTLRVVRTVVRGVEEDVVEVGGRRVCPIYRGQERLCRGETVVSVPLRGKCQGRSVSVFQWVPDSRVQRCRPSSLFNNPTFSLVGPFLSRMVHLPFLGVHSHLYVLPVTPLPWSCKSESLSPTRVWTCFSPPV